VILTNPFFQYALVTQLLGSVVLQMKENTCKGSSNIPNKRLKMDPKNGCMYWENDYGRVYVGNPKHTNMIDESLLTLLEDNNDITAREYHALKKNQSYCQAQTISNIANGSGMLKKCRKLVGHIGLCRFEGDSEPIKQLIMPRHRPSWLPPKKKNCAYCNGYGIWPDDDVPVLDNEVTWGLSDACEHCGSHNHIEYMHAGDTPALPWEENKKKKSIGFHAALKRFNRSTKCVELSDTQGQKIAQE